MTIKHLGGVFGRNPTFNDVTIEGQLTFEGNLDINSDITWEDNKKALFGDSGDLQIYHSGTHSYIDDSGTGLLRLRSNQIYLEKYTGEIMAAFTADGSVNLRYDSAVKVETTSSGITVTGTVTETSDRNEKQDIEVLSDAEQRVAVAAKGLLRKFRWKADVEKRGDSAEIYFGIIAQDLKSAFEAEGLDADQYGVLSSKTWTDEETGEEHSRLSVHYSGLLAFIISAI